MLRPIFLLPIFLFLLGCSQEISDPISPLDPLPSSSQLAYQKMETNAFLHYNMNTYSNAEWGYGDEDPRLFSPSGFDADRVVKNLKDLGFKGVVLTAKHHDGFCLWPSAYSDHNIAKSNWKEGKGDIIQEFRNACDKYNIKLGLYISPWDRNHPDYGKPEYITYFKNQVTELLTNYGEIFELWFDGANGGDGYYGGSREKRNVEVKTYYPWKEIHKLVYDLQPNTIIFSDAGPGARWVGNENGKADITSWSTINVDSIYPGMPQYAKKYAKGSEFGTSYIPIETDVSIRPGWYYHTYEDHKVKSVADLRKIYFESVGRNTTLLLNIPLDKSGQIPHKDLDVLKAWKASMDKVFTNPLSEQASISTSSTYNKSHNIKSLTDQDTETFWAPNPEESVPVITFDFGKNIDMDCVVLEEPMSMGQRISQYEIHVYRDEEWALVHQGTTIGYKQIIRFPQIAGSKLRVVINNSRALPLISGMEVYNIPPYLEPPIVSRFMKGTILMTTPEPNAKIYYTLDGSIPSSNSKLFDHKLKVMRKGRINAIATLDGEQSEMSTTLLDISAARWRIMNAEYDGLLAFDDNPSTYFVHRKDTPSDELMIHLQERLRITGIKYLPSQDRYFSGAISKYELYSKIDGGDWELVTKGSFDDIADFPVFQEVTFPQIEASFLKFKAIETHDGENATYAEFRIMTQ